MPAIVRRSLVGGSTLLLGGFAVLIASHQFGCSSGAVPGTFEPASPDATAGDVGDVGMRLTLPGGETINTVTWTITGR